MQFTGKGWLQAYIDYRKTTFGKVEGGKFTIARHPDENLYQLLQPTGLMYGHPVKEEGDVHMMDNKQRLQLLLAESFINSALLFQNKRPESEEEFNVLLFETIQNVSSFYNAIYPEIATSTRTFFGKKRDSLEIAEQIIEKRLKLHGKHTQNYWVDFFQNSLLFLDIFFFGQWVHTNTDKIVADFFRDQKEQLRFNMVRVMSAAAHANSTIETQERKLFEFFISSSELSSDKKQEAFVYLEQGVAVQDLEYLQESSWILRKFFLELAILTIWSDKKVEDQEMQFLKDFSEILVFSEDDFEQSLMAIEGFVLENWSQLDHLHSDDFENISKQFIQRMSVIASKNVGKINKSIRANRLLTKLMLKMREEELTLEEIDYVQSQILFVLKAIPTFVVVALPKSFLSLPLLMQILPNEALKDIH